MTLAAGSAWSRHKVVGARIGYANMAFGVLAALTRSENDLTTSADFRDHALGGTYDLGMVRLWAAWRRFEQFNSTQTNVPLGAWIAFGVGEIRVAWNRVDVAGRVGTTVVDANDARQIGVGYDYNLSKRSLLYATIARIDNQGAATFVIPGGPGGLAGGASSTATESGVRHAF